MIPPSLLTLLLTTSLLPPTQASNPDPTPTPTPDPATSIYQLTTFLPLFTNTHLSSLPGHLPPSQKITDTLTALSNCTYAPIPLSYASKGATTRNRGNYLSFDASNDWAGWDDRYAENIEAREWPVYVEVVCNTTEASPKVEDVRALEKVLAGEPEGEGWDPRWSEECWEVNPGNETVGAKASLCPPAVVLKERYNLPKNESLVADYEDSGRELFWSARMQVVLSYARHNWWFAGNVLPAVVAGKCEVEGRAGGSVRVGVLVNESKFECLVGADGKMPCKERDVNNWKIVWVMDLRVEQS